MDSRTSYIIIIIKLVSNYKKIKSDMIILIILPELYSVIVKISPIQKYLSTIYF